MDQTRQEFSESHLEVSNTTILLSNQGGSIDFEGQWVSGEATADVEQLDLEILAEIIAPMSLEDFHSDTMQRHHASGECGKRHSFSSF